MDNLPTMDKLFTLFNTFLPLKSGQPPYNGQTVHPLPIYCPYISTSEEGTTSEQWTKHSCPTCPLLRGSTVCHENCARIQIIITQASSYFVSVFRCLLFICRTFRSITATCTDNFRHQKVLPGVQYSHTWHNEV